MTVLVVDDSKDTLVLITQMLRSFGVGQVENASDAPSALAILRLKRFDLIICDWQMKPVDGVRFTQLVRRSPDSRNSLIPIIMLTAHGAPDLVLEARDAGITEFLVKPVSPATLLSRIVSVFKFPRDFIETESFSGPDRRRKVTSHAGPERRVAQPKVADPTDGQAPSADSGTPGDHAHKGDAADDAPPQESGSDSPRKEAREILGVAEDATADEIKEAHRRLMKANHPDRGGSTYLAAQINLAKEALLGT